MLFSLVLCSTQGQGRLLAVVRQRRGYAEDSEGKRSKYKTHERKFSMAVYKRGKTYWYKFRFDGERIQQSTKTRNKEAALKIEAAERTRLAMVKAGLAPPEPELAPETIEDLAPAPVPTLAEF